MAETSSLRSTPAVGLLEIFSVFLSIALSSIGGGLQAWARRILVERKGWLGEHEFVELLGLCQLLPGPNVVNMSICIGANLRGPAGALAGVLGLVGLPVLLTLLVGYSVLGYAHLPAVARALHAMAVVAAGFTISMALRVASRHDRRAFGLLVSTTAFAALAWLRWPLFWVMLALGPLSFVLAWRRLRRPA